MKTIDHRILIPSPPDRVWEVVSDISRNPDWQIDCREVIFLTSKRSGPGLRWRYSDEKRREFVYEVSAWYEGLGYEYYFVDGPAFRDARGRIRLQEIPEGTIVQWTFSYETSGMFSGVRDSSLDKLIQDSLRQLWQMLKTSARSLAEHQAKSLMRDAPDVEARSAYQPRHPGSGAPESEPDSPFRRNTPEAPSRPSPLEASRQFAAPLPAAPPPRAREVVPSEPPIEHEDTKPNPAAEARRNIFDDASMIPNDLEAEPDFLGALEELTRFEPPVNSEATQPRWTTKPDSIESAEPDEPVKPDTTPVRTITELPTEPEPQLHNWSPAPRPIAEPEPEVDRWSPPPTPVYEPEPLNEAPAESLTDERFAPPAEVVSEPPTEPLTVRAEEPVPLPVGDTRSIWEIFNVSRPSELGDPALSTLADDEPEVEMEDTPAVPIPVLPVLDDAPSERVRLDIGSRGLRQTIRRKTVRIRRPL